MLKRSVMLYIGLVVMLTFTIIVMLTSDVVELQYIPSILGGLTSSVSIMIGFIATIIVLIIRKQDSKQLQEFHLNAVVGLLIVPIFLIVITYYDLLAYADFQTSVKLAMINLVISYCIVVHLLYRLTEMIRR